MTTPHSRDSALDQWLHRATGPADRTGVATPDCLDAETAAAWLANQLDEAALTRARLHTSDCSRCQALMATLTQLDVPAEPARGTAAEGVRAGWQTWLRWWMAPVGAAATLALVVTVWVRTPAPSNPPASVTAGREGDAVASAPAESDRLSASPSTPTASSAPAAKDAAAANTVGQAAKTSQPAKQEAPRREDDIAEQRGVAGQLAQASPAPSPSAADVGQDVARFAAPAAPVAPPAVPAPAAATVASPQANSPEAAPRAARVVGNNAAAGALAEQSSSIPEFGAPGQAARWRIAGGRLEQRAGAGWAVVPVPPGSGAVRAGAAVSSRVAWAVGAGGLVLLTTDGTTWSRVPFPQATDLVRVEPTSAAAVTVTTVSGVQLSTVDAGATWR